MAATGKRMLVMNNVEKYAALVARTHVFQVKQLQDEIAREVAIYDELCVRGGKCTEAAAEDALPGITQSLRHLALVAAFQQRELDATARALTSYVSISWCHYRSLRCRFRREEASEFYAIIMEDMASAACAAVFLGLELEGQWLGSEFLRHVEGGYEDPYSVDTEHLSFCAWILRRALHRPNENVGPQPGFYAPLTMAGDRKAALFQVLDARLDYSYRSIVRDENLRPRHFEKLFAALFPLELLAYLRLPGIGLDSSAGLEHILVSPLVRLKSSRDPSLQRFFEGADKRLQEMERAVGL